MRCPYTNCDWRQMYLVIPEVGCDESERAQDLYYEHWTEKHG